MKLFRVYFLLKHNEVSNGIHYKEELPIVNTVFAESKRDAEIKASSLLPNYVWDKVVPICTLVTEILGENNRQLKTILRK